MRRLVLSSLIIGVALGHGYVSELQLGDQHVHEPNPWQQKAKAFVSANRPVYNSDYVADLASDDLACNVDNGGSGIPTRSLGTKPGDTLTFYWNGGSPEEPKPWPAKAEGGHCGPVLTYLAACNGDCKELKAVDRIWTKIDHAGLFDDGSWASLLLRDTNSSWSLRVPPIKAGRYLVRHEIIALHATGQPQVYPVCVDLDISGDGDAVPSADDMISLPGAYSIKDPGLAQNIYYPKPTNYTIPGGPIWSAAAGSAIDSVKKAWAPGTTPPTGSSASVDQSTTALNSSTTASTASTSSLSTSPYISASCSTTITLSLFVLAVTVHFA